MPSLNRYLGLQKYSLSRASTSVTERRERREDWRADTLAEAAIAGVSHNSKVNLLVLTDSVSVRSKRARLCMVDGEARKRPLGAEGLWFSLVTAVRPLSRSVSRQKISFLLRLFPWVRMARFVSDAGWRVRRVVWEVSVSWKLRVFSAQLR